MVRADSLIYLDGVAGFLFVVERFGELVLDGTVDCEPPYQFSPSEEDWDEDELTYWGAAIRQAADKPHLAAYIAFEQNRRANLYQTLKTRKPLRDHSYEELKVAIANEDRDYGLEMWGEQASEDDLKRAATDLLALDRQSDADILRKYLRIFRRRPFPFDPQPIIELASLGPEERDENDDPTPASRVIFEALNALVPIHHPGVRQLAFDLIEKRQWLWNVAMLLKSNWQERDWTVFEALACEPLDRTDYHDLVIDIKHLFEAHPSPAAAQTLINIYEYGPCSHCRKRIAEDLHSIRLLPDWMRDECRYDANSDLREWVENL
jgi:hypothetical protein